MNGEHMRSASDHARLRPTPAPETARLREFARRLQALIDERGWNQSDLARAAFGTTTDGAGYVVARKRDRVSVYLTGRCRPDHRNLKAIADALGTTPGNLFPDSQHDDHSVTEAVGSSELTIAQRPGHPGFVQLQVNQMVRAEVAAQVLTLLTTQQANAQQAAA